MFFDESDEEPPDDWLSKLAPVFYFCVMAAIVAGVVITAIKAFSERN